MKCSVLLLLLYYYNETTACRFLAATRAVEVHAGSDIVSCGRTHRLRGPVAFEELLHHVRSRRGFRDLRVERTAGGAGRGNQPSVGIKLHEHIPGINFMCLLYVLREN